MSYPRYIDPAWKRLQIGGNTVYAAGETFVAFDHALVSPEIFVSAVSDFSITFDQAFQFQRTLDDGLVVTKGIGMLEISTDNGSNWANLTSFTGNSAGFPALATQEINLGSAYALETVRLRFRLQSNWATKFDSVSATTLLVPVDEAWYIDNIRFLGNFGEPFTRVFDEDGF